MDIMNEEEMIEKILDKVRILGIKNPSIESVGYLRLSDITTLYEHKLNEYSSPIYFKDERLELKKAYLFLKSLFDNSNAYELGQLFSPEYRVNLQVEVIKAIRDSEATIKKEIENQAKEESIIYNKKKEKIKADEYVAKSTYHANKEKIKRQIKGLKKMNKKKKKKRFIFFS